MNYVPFDKKIFTLASTIIEKHGADAIKQAAVLAHRCETADDIDGSKTWDHVMHAILELNRTWRRDGELCN
jgi:hypothetical protein